MVGCRPGLAGVSVSSNLPPFSQFSIASVRAHSHGMVFRSCNWGSSVFTFSEIKSSVQSTKPEWRECFSKRNRACRSCVFLLCSFVVLALWALKEASIQGRQESGGSIVKVLNRLKRWENFNEFHSEMQSVEWEIQTCLGVRRPRRRGIAAIYYFPSRPGFIFTYYRWALSLGRKT